MNSLQVRRRALHWLVTATGHWLFQGRNAGQQFPDENDVDWKTVSELAYFHNVEPLLHWMVSNTEISIRIPEWLKQKWERAYFGNFLRNEAYFDVLRTLLTECEKAGLPIIVLKGPALIGRIYKDPALRTFSDLVILCSPTDLHRIVAIARTMGYTIMAEGDNPAAAHHVAMFQAASEMILEFHFMPYEIIQNHRKFMQMAWDRREWITVGNLQCPVLCLEMEMLFNIAHLVQHQFDVSVKHYLDIAGILVSCEKQLERDGIETLFRDFGLEQAFDLTTGFLSATMHLPFVPQDIKLNTKDGAQGKFNASLLDLLALLDEKRLLDVRGAIWNFRVAFGNRKRFGEKITYAVKTLVPSSGSLANLGIRSASDAFRYFLRQLRFYCGRLSATLTHLPKERHSKNKSSLAVERAAAKDRITRQLLRIVRST